MTHVLTEATDLTLSLSLSVAPSERASLSRVFKVHVVQTQGRTYRRSGFERRSGRPTASSVFEFRILNRRYSLSREGGSEKIAANATLRTTNARLTSALAIDQTRTEASRRGAARRVASRRTAPPAGPGHV